MSLFTWGARFSVHNTVIDNQHKELFRLANELHAAMVRGEGRKVVYVTMNRLIEYTRSHFREEENLMTRGGYPQYAAHKAEHDSLTSQLLELKRASGNGSIAVTVDTLHFLRAWLECHIMVTDAKVGAYLSKTDACAM